MRAKKYITLNNGRNFRKVSKLMTKNGYIMNHATSRNVLMIALRKMLENIGQHFEVNFSEDKINELLQLKDFHEALSNILIKTYRRL